MDILSERIYLIEINFKMIYYLLVSAAVLAVFMGLVIAAGCITFAKESVREALATPTPTPTPTPPPPTPTPTPTPQPTEDPALYMARSGGHYLGDWIVISRDNVSGYKDLDLHSTVWGYRFERSYHWWSVSWAEYLEEVPPPGMKYLFIYAKTYTDGDDVRPWGIDQDHFRVQVKDKIYPPAGLYDKALRIRELESVSSQDGTSWIGPYGYLRLNEQGRESVQEWGWIKGGLSNAWDGYILFLVPDGTLPSDVAVLVRYEGLADRQWWTLYKKGQGTFWMMNQTGGENG